MAATVTVSLRRVGLGARVTLGHEEVDLQLGFVVGCASVRALPEPRSSDYAHSLKDEGVGAVNRGGASRLRTALLPRLKGAITLVMVLALTGVAIEAVPTGTITLIPRDKTEILALTAVIAVALVSLRLGLSEAHLPIPAVLPPQGASRPRPRGPRPEAKDPGTRYLAAAKHLFASRFPQETIARFITAVCDPSLLVARITEEVNFSLDTCTQSVTRTVIVADSSKTLLMPVMRVTKGHLIDRLHVTASGSPVSTLTYVECQGAIVTALETLFDEAVPSMSPERRAILAQVIVACCSNSRVHFREQERLREDIRDAITRLPADPTPASEEAEAERKQMGVAFQELADYLFESYFIVAVIEPHLLIARVKVTVEHTTRRNDSIIGYKNHARGLLGLGSRSYLLDLPHATESRSYHFRTNVPKGSYIYRFIARPVAVMTPNLDRPTDLHLNALAAQEISAMPQLSPSPSVGLDFAHLYGRDLGGRLHTLSEYSRRSEGRLLVRFYLEYRERPPGLLAMLLPVSLYLAVVSWGIGRYFTGIFVRTTSTASAIVAGSHAVTPTSSWPAVIFGIPVLVSGWLISRLRREDLQLCSLTTVWALIWLLLNAGWAVGLALLSATGPDNGTVHPFFILWIHHPAWAALMFSAGANFIFLIHMWISRTNRYWRRFQLRQH